MSEHRRRMLNACGIVPLTPITGTFMRRVTAGGTSIKDGKAKVQTIYGNTIVFNQLVDTATSSVIIAANHYYLLSDNGTDAIAKSDGTAIAVTGGEDNLFDLTKMFSRGEAAALGVENLDTAENRTTAIVNFRKIFPSAYTFNADELLPFTSKPDETIGGTLVKGTRIVSRDANDTTIGEVKLPIAANNQPLILRSVGDIKDEVVGTKVIRRVVAVDMGTLNWTHRPALRVGYFQSSIPAKKAGRYNLLCSRYINATPAAHNNCEITGHVSSDTIYVYDTDYSDAAIFKQSLQGVMLYYELATPTGETIPAWDNGYIVENGGEELLLPDNEMAVNSAPINAIIGYKVR